MRTTGDAPAEHWPVIDVTYYARLGAVIGFGLALLYTLLLTLFLTLFGPETRPYTPVHLISEVVSSTLFGFLVIAMLPSTLIG